MKRLRGGEEQSRWGGDLVRLTRKQGSNTPKKNRQIRKDVAQKTVGGEAKGWISETQVEHPLYSSEHYRLPEQKLGDLRDWCAMDKITSTNQTRGAWCRGIEQNGMRLRYKATKKHRHQEWEDATTRYNHNEHSDYGSQKSLQPDQNRPLRDHLPRVTLGRRPGQRVEDGHGTATCPP